MKQITSRDNAQVKQVKRLLESSRARRDAGLTILDGPHLLVAALEHDIQLDGIFVAESALARPEISALMGRVAHDRQYLLPDSLLASLSPVETPAGIVGLLVIPPEPTPPDAETDWLALDGVQDAGNVGALLRTAAAAGIREILLGAGCAQPWSPKVLRAAMGAHFVLRLHKVEDLADRLAVYRGTIAATRLDGASALWECDLRGPVAWVFGAEGGGVTSSVAAQAKLGITIPMAPGVESLNVAAAAAICLFEQRRQRTG